MSLLALSLSRGLQESLSSFLSCIFLRLVLTFKILTPFPDWLELAYDLRTLRKTVAHAHLHIHMQFVHIILALYINAVLGG